MNKKIIFQQKIQTLQRSQAMDRWVKGEVFEASKNMELEIRFTVVIPEALHSQLKIKAAKERLKIKEVLTEIITEYVNKK